MTKMDQRFDFGKNWQDFVANALDDQAICSATDSLRKILQVQDLNGKIFLDVGCGSGLSSLAACLLGAKQVISFDYDTNSVLASVSLRDKSNISPEKWYITQGDILSEEFLAKVEPADVVYSWGVLHHTGSMWRAIDNAASKVRPGGLLAIAIYNNVESGWGGSALWWKIKRAYNSSPVFVRYLMEYLFVLNVLLRRVVTLRNPFKAIRDPNNPTARGMEFWHDVRDWMGGFPYEYATVSEIFNYVNQKLGLELIYLNTHDGHICNEYTFRRKLE